MPVNSYHSWKEFTQEQLRRCNTFQLSIDDLAQDLYYDDGHKQQEDTEEELNFD